MVVILDEKQLHMLPVSAPPPYSADGAPLPPFPGSTSRRHTTFAALPPHILLYIVDRILCQGSVERRRKVLYWMTVSLRLVSRPLYVACMHVLRSTYLPAYSSMVKQPYSSDPFPLSSASPSPASPSYSPAPSYLVSPVESVQRETPVLDLFLAAKVREDVWADDTELHLEREEAFQDLFDLLQPRARLEDLVRQYGVAKDVISVSTSGNAVVASCSSPTTASHHQSSLSTQPPARKGHGKVTRKMPFSTLSCSFSPRSAGLVLSSRTGRRTIVEVQRSTRDEQLETAARRLVRGLEAWLAENYPD
ncbi:hypothetical protein M0805_009614 [Coniferiporia weirii]|nr:hypothetical protein M0805_009614 [Coniferiporia weirii]